MKIKTKCLISPHITNIIEYETQNNFYTNTIIRNVGNEAICTRFG